MGAITEGLTGGGATATEAEPLLPRQIVLGAVGIDEADGALDHIGAVLSGSDGNGGVVLGRHAISLLWVNGAPAA